MIWPFKIKCDQCKKWVGRKRFRLGSSLFCSHKCINDNWDSTPNKEQLRARVMQALIDRRGTVG